MFSVVMGQMQEEWLRGVYDCGLSRPLLYILFTAGDPSLQFRFSVISARDHMRKVTPSFIVVHQWRSDATRARAYKCLSPA